MGKTAKGSEDHRNPPMPPFVLCFAVLLLIAHQFYGIAVITVVVSWPSLLLVILVVIVTPRQIDFNSIRSTDTTKRGDKASAMPFRVHDL